MNTLTNNQTEDEINTASKNMDDFDELYELVEQFEDQAH